MKNKRFVRALALMLCLCCVCVPLMGMTAIADSGNDHTDCIITCDCLIRCTGDTINPDCQSCPTDLYHCIGKVIPCNCTVKCTADTPNKDCQSCRHAIYGCKGKAPEPTPAPECACDVKCTDTAKNTDCPVCAASITDCKGTEPTPPPVCACDVKCTDSTKNADCPVCAANVAECKGKTPEPAPVCNCTAKCEAGAVNTACPICKTDLTACKGKASTPAPAPAGSYAISIVAPSGWYTKSAKVEIRVADENGTGWKKVEARIERNGSPEDLTDAFAGGGKVYVPISENCTVYVTVTDKDGKTTTKNRYIECFDRTAPTVKTGLGGKVLRVEANDELSGVEAVYIDGERYTDLTNGTLDVRFRDLGDDYDQLSIQAVDYAGNKSKTVQVKNPNYKAPSSDKNKDEDKTTSTPAPTPEATTKPTTTPTVQPAQTPSTNGATGGTVKPVAGASGTTTTGKTDSTVTGENEDNSPNPFTPDGSATVVDNATDGDGKEFYTIQTPNENVFYLVIDKQRTGENVYFLNAVTEQDLMALAATDAKTETTEPETTPDPEPETTPEPEPTPAPEQKPGGGNMGTILLVLAIVVIGGGAGWYFKIYHPKHGVPELDEDESEFEDEDGGELPPWDEDEPQTEQETEDEE
ncbi:DUF4366 domain-containing protein [Bariatricus massiliensis]|uniref:DUF4366 domain-containing protein n=1 Tax=Bariatricus massiliensis TaxID=1745713 RepID=A0ABS8DBG2_9FIRM|nr:DUF4366 domain-containing protein [Bariatricus massiliensis]MCB7303667.1 DUF4366 domain-containing protein [Bariatricus massiliensis]MCB7373083.1 DUF4366 domain-containing protein [Bariatricus massiliensis]MCB7385753.1 DUF4366 domain-containing protein [Bariatricus massiliensis]MCB7409915.1 DUF4366 domain-containing protein [Bariatricus massiliensis]MCQ5253116.1 DUF4366 domain-containing protein [Bariatricus massiliensis]